MSFHVTEMIYGGAPAAMEATVRRPAFPDPLSLATALFVSVVLLGTCAKRNTATSASWPCLVAHEPSVLYYLCVSVNTSALARPWIHTSPSPSAALVFFSAVVVCTSHARDTQRR